MVHSGWWSLDGSPFANLLSDRQRDGEAGEPVARSDFSLLSTNMAKAMKHKRATPPMVPPTIAPVLFVDAAGAFGAMVFVGGFPSTEVVVADGVGLADTEEVVEDMVDEGERTDGLARVEGAAEGV